jgi:hypothetical protein
MNYATALKSSSWTAEVQGYSQRVIRYTPIIVKAFSKTITPVIIASVKGFSDHWFETECYWRQRITNLAGITYNPLTASIRAAHAELTSTEAQATYRRIRYISREAAMASIAIAVYGVVGIATTIETAQTIYRHAVAFYGMVHARFNPAPVIVPTFETAFAAIPDEAIADIVKDIQAERYFNTQFDQLDSDCLAIVEEEVDEAISQVAIAQLKSARAALAMSVEGDRLASEALAYVVDQAVKLAAIHQPTAPEVPLVDAATALDVPGATGGKQRKPRAKASTGKAAADKPKGTRAMVK